MAKLSLSRVPAFNQSLADHLKAAGWLTYTEIPLGAALSESVGRADVLALKKSYAVRIQVYECKVSRGDFLSDVRTGKYTRYFERAHQVYFATPAGLIRTSEVPEECGLITRGDRGWHVQKAGKVHTPAITQTLLLQCLFREQEEKPAARSLADRVLWEENAQLADRAKSLGKEIAKRLRDTDKEWRDINEVKTMLGGLIGRSPGDIRELVAAVDDWVRRIKSLEQFPIALELMNIAHDLLTPQNGLWQQSIPARLEQVQKKLAKEEVNI